MLWEMWMFVVVVVVVVVAVVVVVLVLVVVVVVVVVGGGGGRRHLRVDDSGLWWAIIDYGLMGEPGPVGPLIMDVGRPIRMDENARWVIKDK